MVVFAQVRNFDFVDYDDLDYVVDNVNVSSGVTRTNTEWAVRNAYTHTGGPLTWLSYQLNAEMPGFSASSFHVGNLAIHILGSCVLFLVLQAATGARWPAAWVAGIFAVHPLHVESVAWISERKDVLAGLFSFLTIAAYLAYIRRGGARCYGVLVVAYAAALMSKPIAVVLPALLLCLDLWPFRRLAGSDTDRRSIRSLLLEKLPLFAMAAVVAVLTVASQASLGAMSTFDSVPAFARVANALAALGWYVEKSIWPSGLAAVYPLRSPVPWLSVVIGTGMLIVLVTIAWTQRRHRPWVTAGCAWFMIALLPVSGLFQTGAHAYADRNMYLPLIGLAIAIAWTIREWTAARQPGVRIAVTGIAVLAIAGAGWQARLQAGHWKNSESLFQRALAVTDDNYIAATGLATTLRRRGELEEPARLYRAALQAAPRHAPARAGLGETLLAQGAAEAAVYELSRAVEIDPSVAEFWVNLGSALRASGRVAESVTAFRRAQALAPDRADVHSGLGAALAETGDLSNAVRELETAISLGPRYADAYLNLGIVHMRTGNAAAAIASLEKARQFAPHSLPALMTSSGVLMQLGRFDEAADILKQAVNSAPSDAVVRSNLGGALLAAGKLAEAEVQLIEAARIAPDLEPVRENLKLLEWRKRKSR